MKLRHGNSCWLLALASLVMLIQTGCGQRESTTGTAATPPAGSAETSAATWEMQQSPPQDAFAVEYGAPFAPGPASAGSLPAASDMPNHEYFPDPATANPVSIADRMNGIRFGVDAAGSGRGLAETDPAVGGIPAAEAEKRGLDLSSNSTPALQTFESLAVPRSEVALGLRLDGPELSDNLGREAEGRTEAEALSTAPGAAAGMRGVNRSRFGLHHPKTIELLPGEELWVIARSTEKPPQVPIDAEHPGCGALLARLPEQVTPVPVPLKHTAVTGRIDGYIASVDVTQQFHNPFASKIEAVYVFPLPENAAVNEFVMTIGERRIRGIIREREKAEQIYHQARSQGHVASLLTQQRPNTFTQKVANIEPGKQIDINIRYFNTLRYEDGAYEFVFPMVVGPRYNPAGTTDGIGAVARAGQGNSQQTTNVSYLTPQERSGHDISLKLSINAGVDLLDVHSVNHQMDVKDVSGCEREIVLSANDSIPNRDFVLRYRVAGDQIKSAMMTHHDQHGQYFTMMVYPPATLKAVQRSAMEMVFVLDCSGSMNGKPIQQAKAAIAHAVRQLTPRDTFQIIQFSSNSSQLGSAPLLATEENIQRGLACLQSLRGSGGTEMIEGIKAALDFPHDEGRFRLVSFMTDGFIGNEQQILETMAQKLGDARVFSFGVGQAPNRYLMDRMAILGRGAVSYLSLNDDAVDVADRFLQRISHPALTDLYIDFGEMEVSDVYPRRLPDLIVGRPVIVTGRFNGPTSTVTVGGRIGLNPISFPVSVNSNSASADPSRTSTGEHPGIAAVWARMKIADLMLTAASVPGEQTQTAQLVTQTALNYNLMSAFTSFVAVDSLSTTGGNFGTTVAVPVPVPEGVRYDTTVSN